MLDFFNNRELSILFWMVILTFILIRKDRNNKLKYSIKRLLKTFFSKAMMKCQVPQMLYVAFIIYLLQRSGVWGIEQLKPTVFWFFTTSFIAITEVLKPAEPHERVIRFKEIALTNLKTLTFLEFIVSYYVFPFVIEFIVVPILFVLSVFKAISEIESSKSNAVKESTDFSLKIIDRLLIFWLIILIVFNSYHFLTTLSDIANKENLFTFLTPAFLSIGFLPYLYLIVVYATYERVFMFIGRFIDNEKLVKEAKKHAVIKFNFRYWLLNRWFFYVRITPIESHHDLVNSFQHIFYTLRLEKNPPIVLPNDGWSPYQANKFLLEAGIKTNDYKKGIDEWHSEIDGVKIDSNTLPSTISYYVSGAEGIAKSLKLSLLVILTDDESSEIAHSKLEKLADLLVNKSLQMELSPTMKNAIRNKINHHEQYDNKTISLEIFNFDNQITYELNFRITSN